jgi:pantoate--beta-alanine ligase
MSNVTPLMSLVALKQQVQSWRAAGERVALVPTMGALHGGHISLTEMARDHADRVIASIFVNPTQFGPNEDFDSYPRTWDSDIALLEQAGVDAVYAPSASEMYPDGFATRVLVDGLTTVLCGAARPGHFDGVGQVVAKLLLQAMPDVAVFGEKDYQQLLVIRRVVSDLNIPVEILGAPTKREADGLAMSSRNRSLTAEERQVAPMLQQGLLEIVTLAQSGADPTALISDLKSKWTQAGFGPIDYLEIRSADTLSLIDGPVDQPAHVFVAARLGGARLIDNLPI